MWITRRAGAAAAIGAAFLIGGPACRQIVGIDDRAAAEVTGEPPPFTAEELGAVALRADRDCAAMARCVPGSFAILFADHADCLDKNAVFWAAHFFGPDAAPDPGDLLVCGESVPEDCDAWATWNLNAGPGGCARIATGFCASYTELTVGPGPDECFPKGTRGVEAACGSGSQCETGVCVFGQEPGRGCGGCKLAREKGSGPCLSASSFCAPGLFCPDPSSSCTRLPMRAYEACEAARCGPDDACFTQCRRLKAEGDEDCSPVVNATPKPASCEMGLVCNTAVSPSRCEALVVRELGEPCGALPDGSFATCARGARCRLFPGGDAACVPALALGERCGTDVLFGNACDYPALCLDGVCRLRGPTACP